MTLRQFLRWWGGQLLSLFPRGRWRNPVAGRTLTVSIDRSRVEVVLPGAEQEQAMSPAEAGLVDLRGKVDTVTLQLGPKDYLVRHLALPRLAISNLVEAVGYQIPKMLPFNRDQVLFACGPGDQPVPDGQVSVWLAAIPRRTLDKHLSALEIALPENPINLREPPAPGQPLGFSWRLARQVRGQAHTRGALWLGLAATWVLAIGLLVYTQQQQLDARRATHDALRNEALDVGQLREQLDLAQAQFDDVVQRRREAVSPLTLLNELTEALDDDTYLINLELKGDELSLQGVSATPAALIQTLEGSELLGEVRFEAAITQAGREAGSRFNISARTTGPRPENVP